MQKACKTHIVLFFDKQGSKRYITITMCVSYSPTSVHLVDLRGRLVRWNPAECEGIGMVNSISLFGCQWNGIQFHEFLDLENSSFPPKFDGIQFHSLPTFPNDKNVLRPPSLPATATGRHHHQQQPPPPIATSTTGNRHCHHLPPPSAIMKG